MSGDIAWTPEQQRAIEQISSWTKGEPQLLSLSGAAGTGKTTILSAIKAMIKGKVMWAAMTGKAALRMKQAAGVDATTLHSVLYEGPDQKGDGSVEFTKIAKPEAQYLVVDESSMMSPKIWIDLQHWKRLGVKMLFVGDGYQLPPVMSKQEIDEHGEDFSVFRQVKGASLTKVMRSGDDIIRVATMLREENEVPTKSEGTFEYVRTESPGTRAINDYIKDQDDHILVTWRNAYRMEANQEIRKRLGRKGVLPNEGEPVLICKNGQGMLNGEVFLAQMFRGGPPLADVKTQWMHTIEGRMALVNTDGKQQPMDGLMPDVKNWRAYHHARGGQKLPEPLPVTYGYVLTAHKSQGSEFRRVTVFLSGSDLRNPHFQANTHLPSGEAMPFATRFLYTAMTRAKQKMTLILGG